MPWTQHYEPAPKNEKLPVLEKLPDGVIERNSFVWHLREADGYVNDEWLSYHFCHWCKGWIPGHASEFRVNTLDTSRLAGRQGKEYFCARCGQEIAFDGMMS